MYSKLEMQVRELVVRRQVSLVCATDVTAEAITCQSEVETRFYSYCIRGKQQYSNHLD